MPWRRSAFPPRDVIRPDGGPPEGPRQIIRRVTDRSEIVILAQESRHSLTSMLGQMRGGDAGYHLMPFIAPAPALGRAQQQETQSASYPHPASIMVGCKDHSTAWNSGTSS